MGDTMQHCVDRLTCLETQEQKFKKMKKNTGVPIAITRVKVLDLLEVLSRNVFTAFLSHLMEQMCLIIMSHVTARPSALVYMFNYESMFIFMLWDISFHWSTQKLPSKPLDRAL